MAVGFRGPDAVQRAVGAGWLGQSPTRKAAPKAGGAGVSQSTWAGGKKASPDTLLTALFRLRPKRQ